MTRGSKAAAAVLLAAVAAVYAAAAFGAVTTLIVLFPVLGAAIAACGLWLLADAAWLVAPRVVRERVGKRRRGFRAAVALAALVVAAAFAAVSGIESGAVPAATPGRALKSLPYLESVPAEAGDRRVGVTRLNTKLASPGINLFALRASSTAYLMDLRGNSAHTFSLGEGVQLHHVVLLPDGDLVGGMYHGPLFRVGWDSSVRWRLDVRFHHHVARDADGHLYALVSEKRIGWWRGLPLPVLDDVVLELSPDGEVLGRTELFRVFSAHVPLRSILRLYGHMLHPGRAAEAGGNAATGMPVCRENTPFDVLHTNTVDVIEHDVPGLARSGDLLLSPRELDLIAVVDPDQGRIRWHWGPGEISRQHQPTLLNNGNILLLDNGRAVGRSRVVELDPVTREIVWEYTASPPESFFTPVGGGVQRLPNGNTLITAEYEGRVFEVTNGGRVVWEYFTPRTIDGERASIYRMERLPPEQWFTITDPFRQ